MEAAFYIVLLYLYTPFIWGLLSRNALNNGHHHGGVLSYTLMKLKFSSHEEKFLIILTTLLIVAIPLAAYATFVDSKNKSVITLGIALCILTMTLSAIYVITSKETHATYKRYSGRLNFIIAISATVNLSRATSYAEGIITTLVGVRASDLPTGLAWLTLIMVPVAWVVTLAIGSMAIYVIALFRTSITDASTKAHKTNYLAPVKRKISRELAPGYAIAFSFAILAISPLTIMSSLLRTTWADNQIRKELVDASFHVKAEKCGIDKPENAKVAYLESGKAIIAIPSKKYSYTFEPIECPTTWSKPEEISKHLVNEDSDQ